MAGRDGWLHQSKSSIYHQWLSAGWDISSFGSDWREADEDEADDVNFDQLEYEDENLDDDEYDDPEDSGSDEEFEIL